MKQPCPVLHQKKKPSEIIFSVFRFINRNGADVNVKSDQAWTLLHLRVLSGHLGITQTLVARNWSEGCRLLASGLGNVAGTCLAAMVLCW